MDIIKELNQDNEAFQGREINPAAQIRYTILREAAEKLQSSPFVNAVQIDPPLNHARNVHIKVDFPPAAMLQSGMKDAFQSMVKTADSVYFTTTNTGDIRVTFAILNYWKE